MERSVIRRGLAQTAWVALVGSALAVGALVLLLHWNSRRESTEAGADALLCYCAAGLKTPVQEVAQEYQKELGAAVHLQFGGSGTLLSSIRIVKQGDLYLAADNSFVELARAQGLVAESIPIAEMRPVIVVKKGNPKNIKGIEDLLREDVQVSLANPDAAAVGSVTRRLLAEVGQWDRLSARAKVFKPTVTDVANDVRLGVDAGIAWDATASQYPELEMVRVPVFEAAREQVTVAVLSSSQQPTAALRFARYLGARDRGLPVFRKHGFEPVEGDVWAETPQITLYSGGVNRPAIEETIRRFAEREGVRVTTVYNGCGILTAQMRAIQKGQRPEAFPDAYLACDVSFMTMVQDLFLDSIDVSATDMVLLVARGNPKGILSPADLVRPGLRVGLADPQKSALGALSQRLLEELGLYAGVEKNVKTLKPTADFLVNDMRAGGLDAVMVYEANTAYVKDKLDVIRIDHPAAKAVQPYAIGRESKHKQTLSRLLEAIRSAESRSRYESIGFRFLMGPPAP